MFHNSSYIIQPVWEIDKYHIVLSKMPNFTAQQWLKIYEATPHRYSKGRVAMNAIITTTLSKKQKNT